MKELTPESAGKIIELQVAINALTEDERENLFYYLGVELEPQFR
jgi:hypothetical protein